MHKFLFCCEKLKNFMNICISLCINIFMENKATDKITSNKISFMTYYNTSLCRCLSLPKN